MAYLLLGTLDPSEIVDRARTTLTLLRNLKLSMVINDLGELLSGSSTRMNANLKGPLWMMRTFSTTQNWRDQMVRRIGQQLKKCRMDEQLRDDRRTEQRKTRRLRWGRDKLASGKKP